MSSRFGKALLGTGAVTSAALLLATPRGRDAVASVFALRMAVQKNGFRNTIQDLRNIRQANRFVDLQEVLAEQIYNCMGPDQRAALELTWPVIAAARGINPELANTMWRNAEYAAKQDEAGGRYTT